MVNGSRLTAVAATAAKRKTRDNIQIGGAMNGYVRVECGEHDEGCFDDRIALISKVRCLLAGDWGPRVAVVKLPQGSRTLSYSRRLLNGLIRTPRGFNLVSVAGLGSALKERT
jgi:hypothetical protein